MDLVTAKYIKDVMELPFEKRKQYMESLSKYIYYMEEMNRLLAGHAALKRAAAMATGEPAEKVKLN